MANSDNNSLLPAYLVVGDDALKRDAVMKKLRMRLEKMGDLSFNFDGFSGETADGAAIVSACQTIPFASEKRLVQVSDAEKLKKHDWEPVVEYLSSPNETTVLIMLAEKMAASAALYKAVSKLGKTAIIDCSRPKARALPAHISRMAAGYGLDMNERAAQKMIELIGEDTVRIDAELNKLSLALGPSAKITDKEIKVHVAQVSEAKPWEFVNAFSARNISECIRLHALMPSVSALALLGMCTSRIRELICAKSIESEGGSVSSALPKMLGVPDWKVKNHAAYARRFTSDELRCALESAMYAERGMKSGSDSDATFIEWVLSVLRK